MFKSSGFLSPRPPQGSWNSKTLFARRNIVSPVATVLPQRHQTGTVLSAFNSKTMEVNPSTSFIEPGSQNNTEQAVQLEPPSNPTHQQRTLRTKQSSTSSNLSEITNSAVYAGSQSKSSGRKKRGRKSEKKKTTRAKKAKPFKSLNENVNCTALGVSKKQKNSIYPNHDKQAKSVQAKTSDKEASSVPTRVEDRDVCNFGTASDPPKPSVISNMSSTDQDTGNR